MITVVICKSHASHQVEVARVVSLPWEGCPWSNCLLGKILELQMVPLFQ